LTEPEQLKEEFQCPRCGGNGCEIMCLPSPMLLHWVINPVLIIHELLLGIRLPRRVYTCIKCDYPLALRQFLQCPSCRKYHSWMLWGMSNALGHWFGLFCPDCGSRIPTSLNIFSLLIVIITFPIWYLVWITIRRPWTEFELRRALARRKPQGIEVLPEKQLRWIGIIAGGVLPLVLICGYKISQDGITSDSLIFCALMTPVCAVFLLIMSFIMGRFITKKHSFQAGCCRSCGYDLRGLPTDRCPECGFMFDATDRSTE